MRAGEKSITSNGCDFQGIVISVTMAYVATRFLVHPYLEQSINFLLHCHASFFIEVFMFKVPVSNRHIVRAHVWSKVPNNVYLTGIQNATVGTPANNCQASSLTKHEGSCVRRPSGFPSGGGRGVHLCPTDVPPLWK